jgi:hypothetical protein
MAGFLLDVFYGVAAFVVSHIVYRVVTTYRVPKDARRWVIELEEDIMALIHAHLTVATIRTGLAKKIDHVPKDFEEPLLVASEIGFIVERAVRVEAERRGLTVPRAWTLDKSEPPPAKASSWLRGFFERPDAVETVVEMPVSIPPPAAVPLASPSTPPAAPVARPLLIGGRILR